MFITGSFLAHSGETNRPKQPFCLLTVLWSGFRKGSEGRLSPGRCYVLCPCTGSPEGSRGWDAPGGAPCVMRGHVQPHRTVFEPTQTRGAENQTPAPDQGTSQYLTQLTTSQRVSEGLCPENGRQVHSLFTVRTGRLSEAEGPSAGGRQAGRERVRLLGRPGINDESISLPRGPPAPTCRKQGAEGVTLFGATSRVGKGDGNRVQ